MSRPEGARTACARAVAHSPRALRRRAALAAAPSRRRIATRRRSRSTRRRRSCSWRCRPRAYAPRRAGRSARPARRRRQAASACRSPSCRPLATVQPSEQVREASLYPLPARPAAGGVWPSPVEVVVEGDRIRVRAAAARPARVAAAPRESGGWLIDLGETRRGDPLPQAPDPALVRAGRVLGRLPDRDQRRPAPVAARRQRPGDGVAIGAAARWRSPIVGLPEAAGRFVRLVWAEPGAAPTLSGASVLVAERQRVAVDSTRELIGRAEPRAARAAAPPDAAAKRALHFDLGGVVPLVDVDLRFDAGTHVAPVRLQGRARADQPWREVGSGVFYRLERGGEVGSSPALAVPADVALSAPGSRRARGVARRRRRAARRPRVARVARLRRAGRAAVSPARRLGAMRRPARCRSATLVPQLDSERARFGRATLGAFAVDEAAAHAAEQRVAAGAAATRGCSGRVLIVGVAGLGALVWRLARSGPARRRRRPPTRRRPCAGSTRPRTRLRRRGTRRPASARRRGRRPPSRPSGSACRGSGRRRPTASRTASTPTNTANGLIRLARPVHHGVSRLPTMAWIANEPAPMSSADVDAVELDEADDRRAEADDDRADVGNEVGDAGGDAPDRRVVEAERVEREAGRRRRRRRWSRAGPAGSAGSAR